MRYALRARYWPTASDMPAGVGGFISYRIRRKPNISLFASANHIASRVSEIFRYYTAGITSRKCAHRRPLIRRLRRHLPPRGKAGRPGRRRAAGLGRSRAPPLRIELVPIRNQRAICQTRHRVRRAGSSRPTGGEARSVWPGFAGCAEVAGHTAPATHREA